MPGVGVSTKRPEEPAAAHHQQLDALGGELEPFGAQPVVAPRDDAAALQLFVVADERRRVEAAGAQAEQRDELGPRRVDDFGRGTSRGAQRREPVDAPDLPAAHVFATPRRRPLVATFPTTRPTTRSRMVVSTSSRESIVKRRYGCV